MSALVDSMAFLRFTEELSVTAVVILLVTRCCIVFQRGEVAAGSTSDFCVFTPCYTVFYREVADGSAYGSTCGRHSIIIMCVLQKRSCR